MSPREIALIVGSGQGLSASLARLFAAEGMQVALAARNIDKLAALVAEIGASAHACDASDPSAVCALFAAVQHEVGAPDIVVYNASNRGGRGPIEDLDPQRVREGILVTCYGGFLVGQAAARLMIARGSGTILFTGASASYKGYARSSSFAMGKFGLRGLAQSMARELAPRHVHVAHFPIDGGIRQGPEDPRADGRAADGLLDPDAIARTYLHVHRQHRSAWSWEIELRPWSENF
jgi:NAD(P)-dependent dehydrogenase (short-subunit alcohol dehydrogenase family)